MAASTAKVIKVMEETSLPEHQRQPPLKCPRCDSSNTKFCYYNNYSLSQPRHFCKSCKRYWTRGGTLRNVPVGGGCRKNKRVKKPAPPPFGDGIISAANSTANTSPSTVQQQTDLSSSANPISNSMFYSLPTSCPELNFPFSRFSTSDISSGFDFNLPQMNGLGLGFEYKDDFNPVKKMEDVSTSCPSIAVDPEFFGPSTFAASTSTMASLLASSIHHQKYIASGLMPYDGMQMPEDDGIKEKEYKSIQEQNRLDWSLYPVDHQQIHDSTDPASSLLWNSSVNAGSWNLRSCSTQLNGPRFRRLKRCSRKPEQGSRGTYLINCVFI